MVEILSKNRRLSVTCSFNFTSLVLLTAISSIWYRNVGADAVSLLLIICFRVEG